MKDKFLSKDDRKQFLTKFQYKVNVFKIVFKSLFKIVLVFEKLSSLNLIKILSQKLVQFRNHNMNFAE